MRNTILAVLILVMAGWAGEAAGRSDDMKQLCVKCHTMHNSQGGSQVYASGAAAGLEGLLSDTCYGCHSSANDPTALGTPYVFKLGGVAPNYGITGTETGTTVLAGGNFFWVANVNEAMGHNVLGVVASQDPPRIPPGGTKQFSSTTPLTCAGTNGCHGKSSVLGEIASMAQTHHSDDTVPITGASVQTSYRFLEGIIGIEDPDRELTVSSADHNQYKGFARSSDTDSDASSISHLCARCHGAFHSGAGDAGIFNGTTFGVDPWIRHPVDYSMVLTGEYASYGGAAHDYNPATPVANDNMAAGVISTVATGDAIITCITCHRAHGSPYEASLRWDYRAWPAGGYNGCGDCHTAKN